VNVNSGSEFIFLIKRFGGYRNKLYICKQEQKRNEYAKEYKKEKQNGHLSSDAPCEHRVPCSPEPVPCSRSMGCVNYIIK